MINLIFEDILKLSLLSLLIFIQNKNFIYSIHQSSFIILFTYIF